MIINGRDYGQHLNTRVITMDTLVHTVNVLLTILTDLNVCVCQGMNSSLQGLGISETVLRDV